MAKNPAPCRRGGGRRSRHPRMTCKWLADGKPTRGAPASPCAKHLPWSPHPPPHSPGDEDVAAPPAIAQRTRPREHTHPAARNLPPPPLHPKTPPAACVPIGGIPAVQPATPDAAVPSRLDPSRQGCRGSLSSHTAHIPAQDPRNASRRNGIPAVQRMRGGWKAHEGSASDPEPKAPPWSPYSLPSPRGPITPGAIPINH